MPSELAGDGVNPEPENLGPAIASSRSRRFLNVGLSIFQSKRFASSSGARHRLGASLDSSAACLGGGSFHWQYKFRDALFCEQPLESTQCRQPSVRPKEGPIQNTVPGPSSTDAGQESNAVCNDQHQCNRRQTTESTIASHCDARSGNKIHKDHKDQSRRRKASLWLRIVGRFAGKNRVREESSSQAKDHVLHDVQKQARAAHLQKAVEVPRSSRRSGTRSQPPVAAARKGAKRYKWVSCEDLARVSSHKDQSRSHDELVKPVLEPVSFATTDSCHCPEEVIHAPRKTSQPVTPFLTDDAAVGLEDSGTRKKLLFLPSRDDQNPRVVEECRIVVTHLRCKKGKEQGVVAAEARLLAKNYPAARATLAALGVIAPLVSMLDATSSFCAQAALLALHTLAIGNDVNKAAVVDAGATPKMLNLLRQSEPSMQEAVVANLLSLSALDRNKPLIGSSGAISQLVQTLRLGGEQIRRESLRALYNLSLGQSNIKLFVEADATTVVLETLKTCDVNASCTTAEKALAVVGNMVATPVGRKSVTDVVEGLEILIDVLGWGVRFSKCQERAAYILMVIAHQSYGHRQAMVDKRAIPALLEVSLLGSALAQKRAVRILECLREDREQGRPMSAPMGSPHKARHSDSIPEEHKAQIGEGSRIVNHMVQQSLEQNLQRIVRRANLTASLDHMRASSLSGCSSSKSLPF